MGNGRCGNWTFPPASNIYSALKCAEMGHDAGPSIKHQLFKGEGNSPAADVFGIAIDPVGPWDGFKG